METVFTFSRHERKNIMKKIIATFLLLLTLTAPLFGCDNSDISETSDPQSTAEVISRTTPNPETDFEYSALENGTISIDKYIGNATEVVIPDTIDGKNVTEIGKEAFRSADVTSVVMPQYLRTIRYYAFYDCSNLTSVTIGNSVESIGKYAFAYCSNLTSIMIPDSVTNIGKYAFYNCDRLINVTIGKNILNIENNAFMNCISLTSIDVSNNNTNYSTRVTLSF